MLICKCKDINVYKVTEGEVTYICEGCYKVLSQKKYNIRKTFKKVLGVFKKPS